MQMMKRVAAALGGAAVLLLGSCVSDSCACVTLPDKYQESWLGVTPLSDTLDFNLTVSFRDATVSGSGVTRRVSASPSLVVSGTYDTGFNAPSRLTVTGWFPSPVTWTRTTPRNDSLYGIVQLPPGIRDGDTLGLSLYRRR